MSETTHQHEFLAWAGINHKQAAQIKHFQHKENISFFQAAFEHKFISQQDYIRFFSEKLKIPAADPSSFEVSEGTQHIIPARLCRAYNCFPFYQKDRFLFVAMTEPDNILAIDDIRFMTGLEPLVHVTDPQSLQKCFEQRAHEDSTDLDAALAEISELDIDLDGEKHEAPDELSLVQEASQGPVVKMVNLIILDAIRKKASDVHIESYEKSFRVRYRIDGVLQEFMRPPLKMRAPILSRLKIMSSLNIAEKRLPQDGRIKIRTSKSHPAEFRISVLPTLFGEKIVMRFLDQSALSMDMSLLGIDEPLLSSIQQIIAQPCGMFLSTGPTGSGKTTTLYSILMELNKEDINISTVEDPVEFSLSGVNQVHVNDKIGLTFSSVLRSLLRQDPDVILVGEIRDSETAQIAVKASLTGHLVLSTLHTNDAPSTISRLLNMGVENYLLSSALSGILAQRLARKLCPLCKREAKMNAEIADTLSKIIQKSDFPDVIWEPAGCPECLETGYKGRTGIYEMLVFTPEIRDAILNNGNMQEIQKTALQQGMQTLRQHAVQKFLAGTVSYQEILRVTSG